jgi:hypothetical protein
MEVSHPLLDCNLIFGLRVNKSFLLSSDMAHRTEYSVLTNPPTYVHVISRQHRKRCTYPALSGLFVEVLKPYDAVNVRARRPIQRRRSRSTHERGTSARAHDPAEATGYGSSSSSKTAEAGSRASARKIRHQRAVNCGQVSESVFRRRCGRLERGDRWASSTSLSIGPPLASRALDRLGGALGIIDALAARSL